MPKCRVTLAESYFLSELLYSPSKDLDNISTVSLLVVTFPPNGEWDRATRAKKAKMSDSGSLDALKLLTGSQHWILDIDLDFFSTANPFCSSLIQRCAFYVLLTCMIGAAETSQRTCSTLILRKIE